jgi:hypothetical protein
MATRIQNTIIGMSTDKQADISTASSNFVRFKKLNTSLTSPAYVMENDAPEIGKGNEWISQVFKSHVSAKNTVEKFASSEWVTWATAFTLGNVSVVSPTSPATGYTYTITPIDPTVTLELPYFSYVEQVPEGGGEAIDNLFVGCSMEEFTYSFNYGPGRASSKLTASWDGSGQITTPSGVTVPAITTEHNMLAASMTLTINGVDYVGSARIVSGSIGYKNNLLLNQGYFPGSGELNGYQVRGRQEIGARAASFAFVVRAVHGSTEYSTLTGQSSGTAVLSVNYDSNNSVQFTFEKMYFQAVELGEVDGLVTFHVTGAPAYDATNGLLSITAVTPVSPR